MSGKLIIIESGSDASGKATQTKKLYERLIADGYKVRKVEYPNYDSESSALVKMYLRGEFGKKATDVDPYIASTFYAADRYASFKTEWEEFYNNGGIILADRYTTSNMVHQAAKMDAEDRDKLLKDYSHGMKNKMQMLVNIIAEPNVFLLDEPLTSLDVVVAEEMKELFRELKKDRVTILSTHILDLALDLCDEIVLLSHGRLELVHKEDLDDQELKEKIIAALREESHA